MILDYSYIELEGKKVFEKIIIKNEGRFEKILSDEACYMFILQGKLEVRTPIASILISRNEGFLSKCGEYFLEDIHQDDASAEIVEAVAVYFHPSIIAKLFSINPVKSNQKIILKIQIDEGLEQYKDSLIYYLNNIQVFNEDIQLLKIKELILLLFQSSESDDFDNFISALFSPQQYNFMQIIEHNCISSLTLNELATLCNVSLATFNRKFKELYQDNPSHYIKMKKLEKSVTLLKSSELQINEIAFNCGFESVRSFNRLFKLQFKQTPSNYRLSQNG